MRKGYILCLCLLFARTAWGQKMLIIERANRAETTKLYVGESLTFRLAGAENYWYQRTITDILPASNTLLLDNFPVKLEDIAMIKVRRKPFWRIAGAATVSLGATLALATFTGRVLYNDRSVDVPSLSAISVVSAGTGMFLLSRRKLKLGKKHRLRIIEIGFPDPLIAPPPVRH